MVVMCSIAPSGAVHSYMGVGAAAGDGVAAVAVGGLGRHVGLVLDVDVDGRPPLEPAAIAEPSRRSLPVRTNRL